MMDILIYPLQGLEERLRNHEEELQEAAAALARERERGAFAAQARAAEEQQFMEAMAAKVLYDAAVLQ